MVLDKALLQILGNLPSPLISSQDESVQRLDSQHVPLNPSGYSRSTISSIEPTITTEEAQNQTPNYAVSFECVFCFDVGIYRIRTSFFT
jgi:hypothetical protein